MAPSVMVPLYIYPSPGAWDPLFQAASTHPDLGFTVVINPHSGPGVYPVTNTDYTRDVPKLVGLDNVRTLGYVATHYGTKSLQETLAEVDIYSRWAEQDSGLALDGIFFDETPTHWSPEIDAYLSQISDAVHEASGLEEGFVVHNPGYIPDPRYITYADQTVVFEQTYDEWMNMTAAHRLADLTIPRSKLVTLMHSLPTVGTLADESLHCLVKHLMLLTNTVFFTDLTEGYYTSFSERFADFVGMVAG